VWAKSRAIRATREWVLVTRIRGRINIKSPPLWLQVSLRLPGTSTDSVLSIAPRSLVAFTDTTATKARFKSAYARIYVRPVLLSLLHSTGEFTTAHKAEMDKIDLDGHMHEFYDMRGNTFKPQKLADTLCSMLAGTAPRILQVAISPTDSLLEFINKILVHNGRLLPDGSVPAILTVGGTGVFPSSSSVGSASVTSSQRELH
jgi:hypothetical protein